MTRPRYALYVLTRIIESAAVALAAALLARSLQRHGILAPIRWAPRWSGWARHAGAARALSRAESWAWPSAWALLAHLLLGPKQTRPVYLRVPGAMYVYAGVKVGRNAGCRGGCVTGATGSGKTLACILPRLHSLCVNEPGVERREWASSEAAREFKRARKAHMGLAGETRAEIARLASRGCGPGGDARMEELRRACELSAQGLQRASDAGRRQRFRFRPGAGLSAGRRGTSGRPSRRCCAATAGTRTSASCARGRRGPPPDGPRRCGSTLSRWTRCPPTRARS